MIVNDYQTILCNIEDNILNITLNRADKRNALDEQMVKELNSVFMEFRDDNSIIAVTLTGSGKSFCAGADLAYLKSLQTKSYSENLQDSQNLKEMYWNIFTFPKITVGLVNGPAIAGGCGLITVLDIAIASKNAIFGYPEVKIGFVASIVSIFLIHTVGIAKAKQLLYTGELVDAVKAQDLGLVHKIIENDDLVSASYDFFSHIRKCSPEALKRTKLLLIDIYGNMIKEKLEKACVLNAESRQTDDFKEGIQSFLEKRAPNWNKE